MLRRLHKYCLYWINLGIALSAVTCFSILFPSCEKLGRNIRAFQCGIIESFSWRERMKVLCMGLVRQWRNCIKEKCKKVDGDCIAMWPLGVQVGFSLCSYWMLIGMNKSNRDCYEITNPVTFETRLSPTVTNYPVNGIYCSILEKRRKNYYFRSSLYLLIMWQRQGLTGIASAYRHTFLNSVLLNVDFFGIIFWRKFL